MLTEHPSWRVYDSSKIQEFQTCPRRYFYRYILGWDSEFPSNHLVFGAAIHEAMEHLLLHGYSDASVQQAFELFLRAYRKELPEETDEMFEPKTPAKVLPFLLEYVRTYQRDFEEFEVLYTEIAGTVPIADDIVLHFRQDAICRKKSNDQVFSLEHKTLGRTPSRQWTEQWDLKTQVGTYTHVLYSLFSPEEVFGVVINALGFLKTKNSLLRHPIHKSLESMQVWLWNTLYWVDQIRWHTALLNDTSEEDEVMMAFPMNTESCTKYYGCPFKDFCSTWSNPLRHCDEPPAGFTVRWWNPLEQPARYKVEEGKLVQGDKNELRNSNS